VQTCWAPRCLDILCRPSPKYKVYEKLKTETNISETDAEFFLAGMRQKWDEGGGRVLLGDNTRGGEVMMWPIRFQCDPVCIST